MTYEQTKEQFLIVWNSNAYLNICSSDDMYNAIRAIEKQVPNKPKRKMDAMCCPTCETILYRSEYCPECGQKIDWK